MAYFLNCFERNLFIFKKKIVLIRDHIFFDQMSFVLKFDTFAKLYIIKGIKKLF